MTTSQLPFFSVVTVSFNLVAEGRAEAMRRAAESLWAQTCQSVEHILQDGGSDDGTVALLEEIAAQSPEHIKTDLESVPDKGIYDGMNRAVERARGQYVIFLNSDDLLGGPNALKLLQDILQRDHLDFAFGSTAIIDPETGVEKVLGRPSLAAVLQRMPFGHNAAVFRRDMFCELGGHDLNFRLASDYDFVLRMLAGGYQGAQVQSIVSRFYAGGASSDHTIVKAEYAKIWGKNFSKWADISHYDQKARENWYLRGHMPTAVPMALLRSRELPTTIRRAAWHSLGKSLRRNLTGRRLL